MGAMPPPGRFVSPDLLANGIIQQETGAQRMSYEQEIGRAQRNASREMNAAQNRQYQHYWALSMLENVLLAPPTVEPWQDPTSDQFDPLRGVKERIFGNKEPSP